MAQLDDEQSKEKNVPPHDSKLKLLLLKTEEIGIDYPGFWPNAVRDKEGGKKVGHNRRMHAYVRTVAVACYLKVIKIHTYERNTGGGFLPSISLEQEFQNREKSWMFAKQFLGDFLLLLLPDGQHFDLTRGKKHKIISDDY